MRWPDPATAGAALSGDLGVALALRVASVPLAARSLSAGERQVWDEMPEEGPRRREWLLGRAALKPLMEAADSAEVVFPHKRLSLSHSGPVAVAVSVGGDLPPAGVGVDIESRQDADPRTARFFLHADEPASHPQDVLRLWTIKEALFKATPANAGGRLLNYRVADTSVDSGTATDVAGRSFRFASGLLGQYRLTVALCVKDAHAAD